MSSIRVLGLDPSVRNTGLCVASVSLTDYSITVENLVLTDTEKRSGKSVRKNSDDLRRAEEIALSIKSLVEEYRIGFAISEIPTGAQSARAAWMLGMTVGVLASLRVMRVPLIQVQPVETKLASVGSKTAGKADVIAWAMAKYPKAPWLTRKLHGEIVPIADNEHLADAVAVIHAGIETDQFAQAVALLSGMTSRAA